MFLSTAEALLLHLALDPAPQRTAAGWAVLSLEPEDNPPILSFHSHSAHPFEPGATDYIIIKWWNIVAPREPAFLKNIQQRDVFNPLSGGAITVSADRSDKHVWLFPSFPFNIASKCVFILTCKKVTPGGFTTVGAWEIGRGEKTDLVGTSSTHLSIAM